MTLLKSPSPIWTYLAQLEAARWQAALGADLLACHHIGSTSVPGLMAKPILDLIPVIRPEALDRIEPAVCAMGYDWMGAFGLPGRRYCRLDDDRGKRLVQAHAYAAGDPNIDRHLAFRDALRRDPELRRGYTRVKRRADLAHSMGPGDYWDIKSPFIQEAEAAAMHRLGKGTAPPNGP